MQFHDGGSRELFGARTKLKNSLTGIISVADSLSIPFAKDCPPLMDDSHGPVKMPAGMHILKIRRPWLPLLRLKQSLSMGPSRLLPLGRFCDFLFTLRQGKSLPEFLNRARLLC